MNWLNRLLALPPIDRTRRNHGLEHATIHLLSQRFPHTALVGHSDPEGFWLFGEVPREAVEQAVHEALNRLRNGEHHLALHPGCGTNYLTAGALAGLAGVVAMNGARRWRDRLERFPFMVLLAVLALLFAQPAGMWLQAHITTSGRPGGLEVVEIIPSRRGKLPAYRVITRG